MHHTRERSRTKSSPNPSVGRGINGNISTLRTCQNIVIITILIFHDRYARPCGYFDTLEVRKRSLVSNERHDIRDCVAQLRTRCRRVVRRVDDVLMHSYTRWPTVKPHSHYHVTILASHVHCGARVRDEWPPCGGCGGGGHSPSTVAQFPSLASSSLYANALLHVRACKSTIHILSDRRRGCGYECRFKIILPPRIFE